MKHKSYFFTEIDTAVLEVFLREARRLDLKVGDAAAVALNNWAVFRGAVVLPSEPEAVVSPDSDYERFMEKPNGRRSPSSPGPAKTKKPRRPKKRKRFYGTPEQVDIAFKVCRELRAEGWSFPQIAKYLEKHHGIGWHSTQLCTINSGKHPYHLRRKKAEEEAKKTALGAVGGQLHV